MPGLLGGLTAALVVPGVAKAQLMGIAITVVLAFTSGSLSGYLIAVSGKKSAAYEDDEFLGSPAEDDEDDGAVAVAPSLGT
jgi:ammonium transporter Rh